MMACREEDILLLSHCSETMVRRLLEGNYCVEGLGYSFPWGEDEAVAGWAGRQAEGLPFPPPQTLTARR